MSIPQIIHQIDEVIKDTHTSQRKRSKIYKTLQWYAGGKLFQNMKTQKPLRILNLLKYKGVGQGSVMKSRSMKRNLKFCMFLIGPLLMVISIG